MNEMMIQIDADGHGRTRRRFAVPPPAPAAPGERPTATSPHAGWRAVLKPAGAG